VKVGDLVKLLDEPEARRNNQDVSPDSVGLVVKMNLVAAERGVHTEGPLASRWVQWIGKPDWDIMYVEDLEVVSEGR
jgi:hypothetical protein